MGKVRVGGGSRGAIYRAGRGERAAYLPLDIRGRHDDAGYGCHEGRHRREGCTAVFIGVVGNCSRCDRAGESGIIICVRISVASRLQLGSPSSV